MTARRQASTTSLSKYARAHSPASQNRSLDFCNAFWGIGDVGVDVLFARMRGAARTMEELKFFWKERAAIEDDYAKRLGKLAKAALGRDEIGELRNSLNTIRAETEKQAGYHANLAGQIRTELEGTAATFHARQLHHKKNFQVPIEKEFKTKQAQEAHVNKAREKYEADCVRINSYTAQSSLVQGKDLDKITVKLERAQQTVQSNERDFANFAKVLGDTAARWEVDWKAFCDRCQDLEEQRMEFTKDNMWAYANAVSTVCVQDDEACEKIRVSLEQMEPEKDMENFVREYGTGNQIPDPAAFVNYNTPDAIPSSSSRPTFRLAQHVRVSQRESYPMSDLPPEENDGPMVNTAGIGAGGSKRDSRIVEVTRQPTQSRGRGSSPNPAALTNGRESISPGPASAQAPSPSFDPGLARRPTNATHASRQSFRVPPPDPHAETIDPTAETYIKVGNSAYKVDLTKDPQENRTSTSPTKTSVNGGVDPLAKHLEELKNAVNSSGSIRRQSMLRQASPDSRANSTPARQSTFDSFTGSSTLSLPTTNSNVASSSGGQGSSSNVNRDYRQSAEIVVGSFPTGGNSRSPSPQPPTAAFMIPKPSVTPSGSEIIQDVLLDYQQSLPGERKSINRSPSARSPVPERPVSQNFSQSPPGHSHHLSLNQAQGQGLVRSPSQLGHAGIGAHGGSRSNSPAPSVIPSPTEAAATSAAVQHAAVRRNSFIAPPAAQIVRAPSPNTVGIALDPSGRVLHDEMAHRYQQQQHQHPPPPPQQHQQPLQPNHQRQVSQSQQPPQQQQQQPPVHQQQHQPPLQQQQQPMHQPQQPMQHQQQQQQPPQQFNQVSNAQRRSSFIAPAAPAPTMAPPPPPQTYGVTPPPPQPLYQQPTGRPSYMQPQAIPQQQPLYNPPPPPVQYQAPVQQPLYTGYQGVNGLQRGQSVYYANTGNPPPQQQQQPPPMVQQQPPQQMQQLATPAYNQYGGYRGPSPGRTPSPQPPPPPQPPQQSQVAAPPTGQTTEEGYPILFYVKALYDYAATIDEEFDFQQGDIIAVTATPEDGWWSGELLDEERRQKGRHIFPSNFVCLF